MDCRIVLDLDKLKAWIEHHPADVDAVTIMGMPLIHCAVFYRHLESIHYLVAMGANLNTQDNSGNTPLHLAVNQLNIEMVQYLLECQASPDIPNALGQTPLHLAVKKNSQPLVSQFLQFHASVNLTDKEGQTPIFYAMNLEIFKQLLAANAMIDCQNEAGRTLLMILLHRYATTQQNHFREMLELAMSQPNINWSAIDPMGRTICHHVVVCDQLELLDNPTDSEVSWTLGKILAMVPIKTLKIRDRHGETCLDLATRLGRSKAITGIQKIIDSSINPLTVQK